MNGKRLIELSISGNRSSLQALQSPTECVSLNNHPMYTSNSRMVSAGSYLTSSTANRGSFTSPTLLSNRTASAVTRGTSVVSNYASKKRFRFHHEGKNVSVSVSGLASETSRSQLDFSSPMLGLTVWTLEDQLLHRLNIKDYGFFHQANCYLVFQSDEDGCTFLHIWSGSQSNQIEHDIVHTFARKLDKSFGGISFMSLEYEGQETAVFLKHFHNGIVVVEGKSKQSLRKSIKYVKRLYRLNGRTNISATCIDCSIQAATVKDMLILEGWPRIYIWIGQEVDYVARVKAIRLAKKIRMWQKNGKSHIIVVDQKDKQMSDALLRKLDSDSQYDFNASESADKNMTNYKPHLYKINGDKVLSDMPLVSTQPLQQKYLVSMDSFLLDMGPNCSLYVWVGNNCETETRTDALHCAESFKQHHCYPNTSPVCRVMEGSETMAFKRTFIDWKDKVPKGNQLVKRYHISNLEKVLFSKTDYHTVAKLSTIWSNDQFLLGNGTVEMWQVNGDILKHIPQEQHRVLYKNHCYIILYRENISEIEQIIIYYWKGSKSSTDCQNQAEEMAMSMDSVMGNKTIIIQVIDGSEPEHFLTALQRSIIVYDSDLRPEGITTNNNNGTNRVINCSNTEIFCVQELALGCIKVSQVSPVSTSLNSSAAYVIISNNASILWYGKNARACEREYSKKIPSYLCPKRLHDYDIITEGRETATFWSLVHHVGSYPEQFLKPKLQRQSPSLSLCSRQANKWFFIDIPDFSQEDLCDTDIFVLDVHDQIQLWIGSCIVKRDHKFLSDIIQSYVDLDPAGRKKNDLQLVFCNQNYEPPLFKKYFKSWDTHGFGGELAYEAARKQLRQENASIDIDCQMTNMAYMNTTKISYKLLLKGQNLPVDIDVNHKEV